MQLAVKQLVQLVGVASCVPGVDVKTANYWRQQVVAATRLLQQVWMPLNLATLTIALG